MNSTRSSILVKVLSLGVLVAGINATLANAQEIKGKFTMPFEAHWGGITLPPGDYTITLDLAARSTVEVMQGRRGLGFVLRSGVSEDKKSGPSAMLAIPTQGGYRITTLHLEELGVTLYFAPPKSERVELAQTPALNRRVPILMASN
jgi:hypothetical protein